MHSDKEYTRILSEFPDNPHMLWCLHGYNAENIAKAPKILQQSKGMQVKRRVATRHKHNPIKLISSICETFNGIVRPTPETLDIIDDIALELINRQIIENCNGKYKLISSIAEAIGNIKTTVKNRNINVSGSLWMYSILINILNVPKLLEPIDMISEHVYSYLIQSFRWFEQNKGKPGVSNKFSYFCQCINSWIKRHPIQHNITQEQTNELMVYVTAYRVKQTKSVIKAVEDMRTELRI